MTTILHVDDHPVMRTTMKQIINACIPYAHVDEAHNGDTALERIAGKGYDLIILDISMRGTHTFNLARGILASRPDTKILLFTGHNEDIYAKKYFQLGVMGYLTKDAELHDIEIALKTVLNGKRYASPELIYILTDDAIKGKPSNPFELLSPRELQIAQYLVNGESVSEISKVLHLHTSTVGTVKGRIYEKLNCTNLITLHMLAEVNDIKRA